MAKKTNKTSHVLNLITGSQPPVASSGETQPSSSASGETQQEGSAAEEPVRVPSANVTDPGAGKRTDRRAGRTARGAGRTVGRTAGRTAGRTDRRTAGRTDRRTDRAAQNKRRDTCTERTGTTGRAEAGRWSKLPGRKYHGGDPYSGTDP